MFSTLYARATGWLSFHHLERRIALIALVFALPSLAIGLQYDDYLLHDQLMKGGPFAAYLFTPQGARASHEQFLEQRFAGEMPWWHDEHVQTRFFRPLSSLSLWLGFAYGAPPWWMHLENCVIYAVIAWLAVVIYRQLGLTGAGLGWAALFFGLDMGLATTVGWIAGRNTLLAVCFGFACIALHDRARRNGRPALQAAACVCFALSLLSAELGLCTLGYLLARIHGFWAPLLFAPALFQIAASRLGGGATNALDAAVPRATAPITVVLNAPTWLAPQCQAAMRAYHGELRPRVFMLYAGTQSLEVERRDAHMLELYAAHSWITTPFEHIRNVAHYPFRAGDRIELAHLAVEVREVDASGTPMRARFTYDRPLEDPGLTFRYWDRSKVAVWTPPPVGTRLQLTAASAF